jgi:hypothetical protein
MAEGLFPAINLMVPVKVPLLMEHRGGRGKQFYSFFS